MRMDFPDYHHTEFRSLHQPYRQIYADYGSYGGLNIENDGKDIAFVPQKCHPQPGDLRYSAYHPTMPLFPTPTDVSFPFHDRISTPVLQRQGQLKNFLRGILRRRFCCQRARAAWDDSPDLPDACKGTGTFIRELKSKLETAIEEQDLPAQKEVVTKAKQLKWLEADLDMYKTVGDISLVPMSNPQYTGGCLASLRKGDNSLLIHSTGKDWDRISVTAVSDMGEGEVQADTVSTVQAPAQVYQLHSQTVNNTACCVARMKDSCSMWDVTDTDTNPSVAFSHLGDELIDSPTSVCLSPYIPNEALIATNKGHAILWRAGHSADVVVNERSQRFACPDLWRQCQFGGHPRLITMADRSMVQLHDLRSPSETGTDLFALPTKLLHPEERIQVIGQHPVHTFYHQVATDFSLLLLDQRFPGHPVLQWYHMLSVPQYLCSSNQELADGDHMTLLASQMPPETFAFQYNLNMPGFPPQSKCPPFRISNIDDFTFFSDLSGVVNSLVSRDRFVSSLAGVSLLNLDTSAGRFTAFQLDCHGDLFYQTFSKRTLSGEITQAPGPGSSNVTLSSSVVERCTGWLKALEAQTDSWYLQNSGSNSKLVDASASFTVLSEQKYAHVLCPLCMPLLSEAETPSCETEPDPSSDGDLCHVCGCPLGVTRAMVQANQQDGVMYGEQSAANLEVTLPDVADLVSCQLPLSRLLVKQWHGDTDIQELLKAQDNILKQQKEEKIKRIKEKMSKGGEKTEKPSVPSTPTTPTAPGFAATPQRLLARNKAENRSPSLTPTGSPVPGQSLGRKDVSDQSDVDIFSFISPQRMTSQQRAKRRKKHVTGF